MITTELILLCCVSFAAGFVDSIVGGGGLLQLPAFFIILPQHPVVTLLATNKLVSFSGTAIATFRFSRQISFIKSFIVPAVVSAFIFSFLGAYTVTLVDTKILRPIFLAAMILVFFLTIRNKEFGLINHDPNMKVPIWKPVVIGSVLGYYDGFFGPGTGSFLIIAFVGMVGMTMVQGSAYAKVINLTTNIAAIILFSARADFLFQYAFPMMLFNMGGALFGVRFALLKGNSFVRVLLRVIVFATILKLGYDIVKNIGP